MATFFEEIYKTYYKLNVEWADPRVQNYFLIGSPFPLLGLLFFYVYFVFKLGPNLMKNREPFKIDKILVIFNISQIFICSVLVIQYLRRVLFVYNFFCEPIDYSDEETAVEVTQYVWLYFMIKLVDLLDTVFFVLRKKYNQITFLHMYHHIGMCILTWVGTKYVAGGHGIFLGFINSFVHVIMYFYYLLTAWDEKYKRNVWWKKHLTQLQIFQFLWIAVHFLFVLIQPNCKYPRWPALTLMPFNILLFALFTNFYIKAYVKPKRSIQKSD
ncbi:hypothetical protein FQR65_LT02948 [Abscondita terminalis]|nr:hypothetical protein FQR65_LT02948 [Abscondita terminalis]